MISLFQTLRCLLWMDYEMVRRIRETDGFIPIVFTSGRVSPKDVVKGYELGVNNYIKKPFWPKNWMRILVLC